MEILPAVYCLWQLFDISVITVTDECETQFGILSSIIFEEVQNIRCIQKCSVRDDVQHVCTLPCARANGLERDDFDFVCVSQVFVAFCYNKVIQDLEKENQSVARNDVTD